MRKWCREKTRDVVECFPYFLALGMFQTFICLSCCYLPAWCFRRLFCRSFTFYLHVICAVINSLFYISWNQTTRFHTRFKGHHVQNLLVRGVTFPWKRVCLTHWQKLKTFPKDLSRKRSKISWKRSPLTISLDIRPMDYMTWILVK